MTVTGKVRKMQMREESSRGAGAGLNVPESTEDPGAPARSREKPGAVRVRSI